MGLRRYLYSHFALILLEALGNRISLASFSNADRAPPRSGGHQALTAGISPLPAPHNWFGSSVSVQFPIDLSRDLGDPIINSSPPSIKDSVINLGIPRLPRKYAILTQLSHELEHRYRDRPCPATVSTQSPLLTTASNLVPCPYQSSASTLEFEADL